MSDQKLNFLSLLPLDYLMELVYTRFLGGEKSPTPNELPTPESKRNYLKYGVYAIIERLKSEGSKAVLIEPWEDLYNGLDALDFGMATDLLTPSKDKTPRLEPFIAENKAFAAAAISLAKRGTKEKIAFDAARKLGITKNELKTFRKNLMKGADGPIKNWRVHITYQHTMLGQFEFINSEVKVSLENSVPSQPEEIIKALKKVSNKTRKE
jgi:hypothetical protein